MNSRTIAVPGSLSFRLRSATLMLVTIAIVAFTALTALTASPAYAHEQRSGSLKRFGAGIDVNTKPNAEDTGLPLYPGATIERDRRDDEDGVNLNMWFGSYGLRVVVVKFKSDDNAEKIEAFYRNALSDYGDVLDCSDARERAESAAERKAGRRSNTLTCSDTHLGKTNHRDGKLYKAGTRDKQFGVFVQSDGSGSTFQLVNFEKRGGRD